MIDQPQHPPNHQGKEQPPWFRAWFGYNFASCKSLRRNKAHCHWAPLEGTRRHQPWLVTSIRPTKPVKNRHDPKWSKMAIFFQGKGSSTMGFQGDIGGPWGTQLAFGICWFKYIKPSKPPQNPRWSKRSKLIVSENRLKSADCDGAFFGEICILTRYPAVIKCG